MIVKKMNDAKGLAKTFVKTPTGLKVVAPEGYVAIDKTGGAVKIVDKMEFTFNNVIEDLTLIVGSGILAFLIALSLSF